jgi:hypothetical protein
VSTPWLSLLNLQPGTDLLKERGALYGGMETTCAKCHWLFEGVL